jgi:ABC-2 type transport system permease protein
MQMPNLKFINDISAVLYNEFRVFRRSRAAIILSLIVLPLFFTTSLGGASGGAGTSFSPTAEIPIAFIDNDLTSTSGRLYEVLSNSGDFNRLIQGYREDNAIASLGKGDIYAVIIIPQGFQERFTKSQSGQILFYVDDGEAGLSESLLSTLQTTLLGFHPSLQVQPISREYTPIEIVTRGAIYSGFSYGITIILGLVVIFATFYEIAGGMAKEREEGTYARLLVSPLNLGSLMIGKTIFVLVLNVIRTSIVVFFAVNVYNTRLNTDFITLLVIVLLIALLTMGFAFLISSIGASVRAVVITEFFLVLFLFAFSGFIIDKELLRGISQTIAYLLPWSYGIEILKRTTLIGQPILSLTFQLQFIGISIIIFYVVSYILLRLSRERLAL